MSIHDRVSELEGAGKLHCLSSQLTGEDTARTLWVSSDVLAAVTPPYGLAQNRVQKARLAEFREFLDAFLEHGHFSVAQNPDDKPAYAMIARVHPVKREFWDFRVTTPKPGIRAFGAFAGLNTFIVLTWAFRDDIETGQFTAAVQNCMDTWTELFGSIEPFAGKKLNEYLSEATEYTSA